MLEELVACKLIHSFSLTGVQCRESRKPEVVGVEPQLSEVDGDGSCSTSALIFPLCSQKQRASSFVIAEDVGKGTIDAAEVLRVYSWCSQ